MVVFSSSLGIGSGAETDIPSQDLVTSWHLLSSLIRQLAGMSYRLWVKHEQQPNGERYYNLTDEKVKRPVPGAILRLGDEINLASYPDFQAARWLVL
ncbi:MAG: hypothetical protein ACUVR4_00715 [Anaerolineae bacterium]